MSLLSFFRKNKQADAGDESASQSRNEPASQVVRARKRKTAGRDAGDGSGSAPVDPVLPEKKRARRRLVGAVALVLAVVIGLPMVLDSEPKPLADDVTIEIPSKDRPVDAAGAARRSGAATSRVPAALALDRREEMVDMPGTLPAAKDSHAGGANDSAIHSGAAGAKARAEAAAQASLAASTASGKSDDASSKTNSDGAEAKQAKFILQVAAFASMDKVSELRGKLKSAGIASYTQKVPTDDGDRIRIRVGPFGSKQEAERMRTKLSALGLNGKLLPP